MDTLPNEILDIIFGYLNHNDMKKLYKYRDQYDDRIRKQICYSLDKKKKELMPIYFGQFIKLYRKKKNYTFQDVMQMGSFLNKYKNYDRKKLLSRMNKQDGRKMINWKIYSKQSNELYTKIIKLLPLFDIKYKQFNFGHLLTINDCVLCFSCFGRSNIFHNVAYGCVCHKCYTIHFDELY